MTSRTKFFFLTLLAMMLLIAAQCSAPTPTSPPVENRAGATPVNGESETHAREAERPELKPVNLAAGQKLKVIATTSIVGDIVKQIGGDAIDLTILLPIGTDPHTFNPAPADLATVANAHGVFANGLGLEEFLDEMLKNAGGIAAVIEVSHGVEPRQFGEGEAHEHEDEAAKEDHDHEAEEEHHHEGADPHTWTSPASAKVFAHNIEHALSALDPANAATYAANAQAYTAQLDDLDIWVKAQIKTIPAENRKLVTDHTAFGYYADRYGLQQIGAVIPGFSTAAEPSAKELAELEDAIKEYKVKAIFVGASVNPALSERVAADTGVKLVTLYTGSLGGQGSGAETYLDYIRYNTTSIVNALK